MSTRKRLNGRLAEWHACIQCGHLRWVLLRNGQPQSNHCKDCRNKNNKHLPHPSGKHHPLWKGGRSVSKAGYVEIWIPKDHPLAAMRNKDGYVYEHRLVVATKLGRPLSSTEEVHHANGRKADNRFRNLRLFTKNSHSTWHANEINRLRKEVHRLQRELRKASRS